MKHLLLLTLIIFSTACYGQTYDEKEIREVVLKYQNAIRDFNFETAGYCITDESFERLSMIEESLINYGPEVKQEAEKYIKKLKHSQYEVIDIYSINYREAHVEVRVDDDREKRDPNAIGTIRSDLLVVKKQRGKWLVSLIDEVELVPSISR